MVSTIVGSILVAGACTGFEFFDPFLGAGFFAVFGGVFFFTAVYYAENYVHLSAYKIIDYFKVFSGLGFYNFEIYSELFANANSLV